MGASIRNRGMVMDVSPWPSGKGFDGSSEWWTYVRSKDEQSRLNQLLGMALLDESIRCRLIDERDESLLNAFELTEPTKQWIRSLDVASLPDFAQAIIDTYRAIA